MVSTYTPINTCFEQLTTHSSQRMPPASSMDDCVLAPIKLKVSGEGKERFFNEFLPLLHRTKHEVLGKHDNNSWYLVYIGTKVGSRGKGYAKTLIEYTTKQVSSLTYNL